MAREDLLRRIAFSSESVKQANLDRPTEYVFGILQPESSIYAIIFLEIRIILVELDTKSNARHSNIVKVTAKGQVAIPARIRDYFGNEPRAEVDFCIAGGKVVLVKQALNPRTGARFSALRGILKGSLQWMR